MNSKLKIAAIAAVAILIGCMVWFVTNDNNDNLLREAVRKANNFCPYEVGAAGNISSLKYDGQDNKVMIKLDMSWADNDEIDSLSHTRHFELLRLALQSQETSALPAMMAKAKASAALTCAGQLSECTVDFSVAEIDSLSKLPLMTESERAEVSLALRIDMLNSMCPMTWAEGVSITSVVNNFDKGYIVFECLVDNDALRKIQRTGNMQSLVRAEIISRKRTQDNLRMLIKEMASMGSGLRMSYFTEGHGSYGVDIPSETIANISRIN